VAFRIGGLSTHGLLGVVKILLFSHWRACETGGKRENVKKGIQNFFMMAIGKNIPKAILLLLSNFNNQKLPIIPAHVVASQPRRNEESMLCC